jgi:predicted ester cyclase
MNLRQERTLTMIQNRNRLLIERFYLEMWNRFDKSIFPDILTEDLRFRGSLGQSKSGHAEFGEYVDFIQRAFPDFSNEIEEIISEGDKSFAKLAYSGTHRGEVFGIAPTGRFIRYAGAAVFTFRGDRIAEVWVLGDIHGLISQLEAK